MVNKCKSLHPLYLETVLSDCRTSLKKLCIMVTFMYVYITHMFGLLGKKCIFFSTIMFVVLLIGEGNDKGGRKSEKTLLLIMSC